MQELYLHGPADMAIQMVNYDPNVTNVFSNSLWSNFELTTNLKISSNTMHERFQRSLHIELVI